MMNNTILSDRQMVALDRLVEYSMPDERKNLEEHMLDEFGGDEIPGDIDNMTDDELYALAEANSIGHIWIELYHLSKAN